MILSVQPDVIDGLMKNRKFRGRGLVGRFIYAACPSLMGHRKADPAPIPREVKEKYHSLMKGLMLRQHGGELSLSAGAREKRVAYTELIEERLELIMEHMQDWGGKLVGTVIRIAALLHVSDYISRGLSPAGFEISPNTMQKAIDIGECLCQHAMAAYTTMNEDPIEAGARYLLRWLEWIGKEELTQRTLYQRCRGKFSTVDEMTPSLKVLVENNYIRVFNKRIDGAKRASKVITINPYVLDKWCF